MNCTERLLITPAECEKALKTILDLRPFWINRRTLYTLGAAAYIDDPYAYPAIANMSNKILAPSFGTLYARIFDYISELRDAPTTTIPGTGLPGFHIFEFGREEVVPQFHQDEPYLRIAWGQTFTDPFTFTIPIELPSNGGGMESIVHDEITYTPYEVGKIYLHDGMVPHRIADRQKLVTNDRRITLQGHGVMLEDGRINLYF